MKNKVGSTHQVTAAHSGGVLLGCAPNSTSLRKPLARLLGAILLTLFATLEVCAQSRGMVSMTGPDHDKIMADGRVPISVHLYAPANPSTLAIEANGKDITHYFQTSRCAAAPCDLSANLNANIVNSGWNYLRATVYGPSASVDMDNLRFYNDRNAGTADATTGYEPSFAVHVHATETSGLEVDYAPGSGNTRTYYPNSQYPHCLFGQLTLLTLDRTTLAPKSVRCYGASDNAVLNTYLKTLTKQDLVFASGNREIALGKLNLAPIGGTDFTATGAPPAYGYSVIGYGASSPGLAVESYNASKDYPWHGVEGVLVNLGATTPMYGFRATDSPAFAIQPAASGGHAKITLGYNTAFPIGQGSLPSNYTLPTQFTNTTYTSPDCNVTCSGGLYTAFFDAYTLQLRWANTYATNSVQSAEEITRMTNDLKYHLYGFSPGPSIVMIASVGNPFGTSEQWGNAQYSPSPELVDVIQKLGVSGSAFGRLIAGGSFSMIGITNGLPGPNQGVHSITKWYGSTLQKGETGDLRGVLLRDKNFLLKPEDVGPFALDSSNTNPTANDLLAFAAAYQIGRAPSVSWPMMNTDGRRRAYAYASDQMNRRDFYAGNECRLTLAQCQDIRARYTSNQLGNITSGIDPVTIAYPSGESLGFTQDDLTDVTMQLANEKQYLQNAAAYASVLKEINTNGTMNVGSTLQSSATSVAASLYDVDRSANSTLSLVPDILGSTAAVTSVAGVYTPAGVVSGVLGTASSFIGLYNSVQSKPDPEVTKLANLLADQQGNASAYATMFNNAVLSSTGVYFNAVYSDWFKLQTVGLMAVTPGSGWYYGTYGNVLTEYNNDLAEMARSSFYQQTVPQYFDQIRLHKIPRSYYLANGSTQAKIDQFAADENAGFPSKFLSRAYSYEYWPTPGYPRCVDYVYMVTKSSRIKVPSYLGAVYTWGDQLGTTLLGPADSPAASNNLNIPAGFFYDTSGYAVAFDTNSRFPVKGECGTK